LAVIGLIDLGKYYRKAYKRNVALKLFESEQGAVKDRKKRGQKPIRHTAELMDTTEDIPPEEEAADSGVEESKGDGKGATTLSPLAAGQHGADSDDDDDDNGLQVTPLTAKAGGASAMTKRKVEPLQIDGSSAKGKAAVKTAAKTAAKSAVKEEAQKKTGGESHCFGYRGE
jgi:hypothetical protein